MKIEHIALYVNDLEAAKDFFVRWSSAMTCSSVVSFFLATPSRMVYLMAAFSAASRDT